MPNFVSTDRYDEELLARAAEWTAFPSLDDLTRAAIEQISAAQGIDFATALLYDRLRKFERHASLIGAVESCEFKSADSHDEGTNPGNLPSQLAIVPGAFYVERPETGASGSVIRDEAEKLGIPTAVIPTRSFGSLTENANIIRDWLLRYGTAGTVLVSLSKGGAEVKWALRLPANGVFQQLGGWINVSGITEGSPIVAWLQRQKVRSWLVRMLFWWRRHDFRVIRELNFGPGQPLSCDWCLPPRLPLVHVVGFPLQRNLSSGLMRRGHRRLTSFGPNDGAGILLLEAALRPGVIYPIWGVDHYLYRNDTDLRILFRKLLFYLERQSRMPDAEAVTQGVFS